jgi:hypothetical protein
MKTAAARAPNAANRILTIRPPLEMYRMDYSGPLPAASNSVRN